jgi:ankyrin repeat protein
MTALRTNIRLTWLVLLLTASYFGPTAYPQQSSSAPTAEQEFLDAIKKGNIARVGELLKQNSQLSKAKTKNGTTAVLLAVYARHQEIAESLLATGIEPSVFEAAATGRVERVRELVKRNPDLVREYSPDGWTALHLNFGNLEIVKVLLDKGADINAVSKNKLSATPLQGAAAMQNLELARLLIARGANVNCRGEEGVTPLHEAAGNGQIELVKLLLANGANVNAKDDQGKTPLATALEYKQAAIAKFLQEHNTSQ